MKFDGKKKSFVAEAPMQAFEPLNDPKDPWGKVQCHPSCKTCLPSNPKPTACTSCAGTGGNKMWSAAAGFHHAPCKGGPCHHTVIDPKYNAGTCDSQPCLFCKPRSCCGRHHKHFIVDPDLMAGVCVRHSDDCTPLCIESSGQTKRTVCSKGCNAITRWDSVGKTTMNVCQADKQVFCDATQPATGATNVPPEVALFPVAAPPLPHGPSAKCSSLKKVSCKASCSGLNEVQIGQLHRVGGTCVLSMVENPTCFDNKWVMTSAFNKMDPGTCDEVRARCPADLASAAIAEVLVVVRGKCKPECALAACKRVALAF